VGTRTERTGIGWKEKRESAGCAARTVRGREGGNTEQRRNEDRMDERDMEEERKNIEGKDWGIEKKILFSL
jgi:hypothetical protein